MQNITLARILTVVAISGVLAACATPGQYRASARYSDECDNGASDVVIAYRDSYLQVTPKTKTKKNAALKFIFKTKAGTSEDKDGTKDNTELLVTVKGEKFVPPSDDAGEADITWLNITGTAGKKRRSEKIVCVPDDQDLGTYFFSVEVEKVGILDPRAEIEQ